MTYLRGFIPWIAYGIVAASVDWRWGAFTALAVSVFLTILDRRSGAKVDAQILEVSAAVFFAVLTVVAFLAEDSSIHEYDSSLSFGWLALTAWVSLVIGKPFTEGIARREVPEKYWHTERFKRINIVITAAWAIAFTVTCAAVTLIFFLDGGQTVEIVVQAAGFVLPVVFTRWYRSKVAATANQAL
ncbi:hypothetical protein GOEFS_075_00220 [Gordonia effusa NBRC 100432]|uniref:Intracellular septation protein A n=2 Tax=Gordonia effusa TaxID=263908 RepID=H0R1Z6_9ACTN|nr:hypothetical protein GOEFS_075_00220 [Gordonia effusa NBRC 100432]